MINPLKFLFKRETKIIIVSLIIFILIGLFFISFNQQFTFSKKINFIISSFLLIMAIQISITIALMSEIKEFSISDIWDNIIVANFFCIIITFAMVTLLIKSYIYGHLNNLILFSLISYVVAHGLANLTSYNLINPIIKRVSIVKTRYIILYISAVFFVLSINQKLNPIIFIKFSKYVVYSYLFVFIIVSFLTVSSLFKISKAYKKIGFVTFPYLIGGLSGTFFGLSVFSIMIHFYTSGLEFQYYSSSFFLVYLIGCTFTLVYYFKYIIEYPSILQPKWRALMPFDIVKVTASITLAFLALSLFFSIRETSLFEVYASINPLWYVMLLILTLLVVLVSIYTRRVAEKTNLKYWNYLKSGLFVYTGASFYVLAIVIFSWNSLGGTSRIMAGFFGLVLCAFYAFYMLDLRYIAKNLNVKMRFDPLVSLRYLLSYISVFFIILFGIGFIHGEALPWPGALALEKHPLIIGFILVFLISYVSYLSTTHRGFEEFMKKNVWSNLSYLSGFFAFVTVFFFYRSLPAVDEFPLHGAFFLAYFGVLLIEIYAINTLKVKPSPRRMGTIVEHLNRLAGSWIRTDVLRDILEDVKQRYASKNPEVEDIQLDEENRAFNFPEIGRNLRNSISVAILLEMYSSDNKDRFSLSSKGLEDILLDIEEILGPKILTLPPDLRQNFDTSRYYPLVLKNTLETISEKFSTFVPESEHWEVINKLARINSFFSALVQEGELPPMGKEEFRKALSIYLETLEESFPFEYSLFRTAMMKTITEELSSYGVRGEEALNIAPTGITSFDEVTGGGIPQNSSTVLQSEETRGKRVFLHNFLLEGLKKGDSVIYLSSGVSYSEVEDYILKELSPEHLRHLTFLDLYSAMNEKKGIKNIEEEGNRLLVPPDLTLIQHAIVKTIKSMPREEHKRVIIDAFTDLAFHYKWEELEEIVGKQIEGYRRWNCTSMVALNPEVVPPKELEDVKKHFNNSLVLKTVGREGKLTLEKLHGGLPRERMVIFHY